MRRKFFFQQNYTKISYFDEGVFTLEPFFWSNDIFKICLLVSKVTIEVMMNFCECFPRVVPLQNYVMNASLIHTVFVFQSTLPGSQTMEIYRTSIVTFETEVANFEMTLPQKNGHRIETSSSKLMILASSCWKRILYAIMDTACLFCPLVFLKSLIVSVAFFLGHPV